MKKILSFLLAAMIVVLSIVVASGAEVGESTASTGYCYPNNCWYCGTYGGGNCPKFDLWGTTDSSEIGPNGGYLNEGWVRVYGNYPSGAKACVYARLEFQRDWGLVAVGDAPRNGGYSDILFNLYKASFFDTLESDLKPCYGLTRTFITVKIKDRYYNDLTSFYRYAYSDIDMLNYAPRVQPNGARGYSKDVTGRTHKWVVTIDGMHDFNPTKYKARVYKRSTDCTPPSNWVRVGECSYNKNGLAYVTIPDVQGSYELTARTVRDGDWVSGYIGEAYGNYIGRTRISNSPIYRLWDNYDW